MGEIPHRLELATLQLSVRDIKRILRAFYSYFDASYSGLPLSTM
jgi:hypothetical protein